MRDEHLEKNNRKKNAEHRRPYRGAKAVDLWCRNHGRCLWCEENRLYSRIKGEMSQTEQVDEFYADKQDTNSPWVTDKVLLDLKMK